jgi:hypothetical protein
MCQVEDKCEETGGDMADPAKTEKATNKSFAYRVLIAVQVGDHHLLVD